MPDLTLSPLTRNAQILVERLDVLALDPSMLEGCRDLVVALNKADYAAAVFFHPELPHFALMAYQDDLITEAQFSTTIMFWEAITDYPGLHMRNLMPYYISRDNHHALKTLAPFLQLQRYNFVIDYQTHVFRDKINDRMIEQIIAVLSDPGTPTSERYFMTFEIDATEPYAELFNAFNIINYHLFIPIKTQNKFIVILPSLTLIQATLSVLSGEHPIQLVPRLGNDTAADIYHMHKMNRHPLGLSYPEEFCHYEADEFKSGRFGFSIHDTYHAVLRLFTPFPTLFDDFVGLGQMILTHCSDAQRTYFQDAIDTLIDNQFRIYTGRFSAKLSCFESDQIWLSKDATLFIGFSAILLRNFTQLKGLGKINHKLQYLNDRPRKERLTTIQQQLMASQPSQSLHQKTEFCRLFIEKLFEQDGRLDAEQLHLAQLIDIALQERCFVLSPSAVVLEMDQDAFELRCMVREILLDFLRDPTQRTVNPWLKGYYQFQQNLYDCIQSNDINRLRLLLGHGGDSPADVETLAVSTNGQGEVAPKKTTYDHYIAHLDRIEGISPPLIEQAVALNQLDTLQLLHTAGAQLRPSMLHSAVQHRNAAMLTFLLKSGLDAYTVDRHNRSIVDICLQQGLIELLNVLLRHTSLSQTHLNFLKSIHINIHPNCQPLLNRYFAFKRDLFVIHHTNDPGERLRLLETLVQLNQDHFSYMTEVENAPSETHLADGGAVTHHGMRDPLVALLKTQEELDILLNHQQIDFNVRNAQGQAILHTLCNTPMMGDEQLSYIRTILDLNADVNVTNHRQETPLMLALKHKHLTLANILIQQRAEPKNHQHYFTNRLLAQFKEGGPWLEPDEARLCFLIQHGFDINQKFLLFSPPSTQTKTECTLQSIWNVIRGYECKRISPHQHFTFFSSKSKTTPSLTVACRMFCIQHGADINELNVRGQLELNVAIDNHWHDYLRYLLEQGADPNLMDQNGDSPLKKATDRADKHSINLLQRHGARFIGNEQDETPCAPSVKMNFHMRGAAA